jgi:hypothetical protein
MAKRGPEYTARGDRIRALRMRNKRWRQENLGEAASLRTATISSPFPRPST